MEIIPSFTEWSNRVKLVVVLNRWTRYFAVAIGFFQALAISIGFNSLSSLGLIDNPGFVTYLLIALFMTAGSMFAV